MGSEENIHIGNSKNSAILLKEILPTLEVLILNSNKEFYTIREAMRVLSISRTQLYYLRSKGLLPSKNVGRKVYITKEAIHDLVMGKDASDK